MATAWELYTEAELDVRLHQGDLIKFTARDAPYEYGIIVTADCDLERRKHSRLVTLVPLLSVNSIICNYLAFDLFEAYREQLAVFCKKQLKLEENWDDPLFSSLVRAYLKKGFEGDELRMVVCAFLHEPFDLTVASLQQILSAIGISWNRAFQRLEGQLKDRGDLLALVPPPDGMTAVEDVAGAALTPSVGSVSTATAPKPRIAWLRTLWQEPIGGIALKNSGLENARGIRAARLLSPYRYRLTQMVGQVFSDIGVPDYSTRDAGPDLANLGVER